MTRFHGEILSKPPPFSSSVLSVTPWSGFFQAIQSCTLRIYLTHERWRHIVDENNHPAMAAYEEHLIGTLQKGHWQRDS